MNYPDGGAVAPLPDWNAPFMSVTDLAPLLGITVPVQPPLDAQVAFAGSAVSRLIRQYCGRRVTGDTYTEEFPGAPSYVRLPESGGLGVRLNLTEWPIESVTELQVSGSVVAVQPGALHHDLGRLYVPLPGMIQAGLPPIRVVYVGGYDPLPFDLQAVYLDLVRQQLVSMGANLAARGSILPTPVAPVKAVTVGALKVDYAVTAQAPASGAAGSASAVTVDAIKAYASTLDQYRSHRALVATGA